MDLSNNIKDVARKHNILLKEICDKMVNERTGKVGISAVSFSTMIRGNISLKNMEQIANIIGCDISEFFASTSPALTCPRCGAKLKLVEDME